MTKDNMQRSRSGFEDKIKKWLEGNNISYEYESMRMPYSVERKYTPDFIFTKANGDYMLVEAKGYFTSADRSKMLAVSKQHPELDIRFLFQRASNKLNKNSDTSYADWADKYNFKWAEGVIPKAWLDELTRSPLHRRE